MTFRLDFVPYALTSPGFESLYGQAVALPDQYCQQAVDATGRAYRSYSLWGFAYTQESQWPAEIVCLNQLQSELGPLNDDTRLIRTMIAGLVACDNGIPATIDELLIAIGRGYPPEQPFHAGCWMSPGCRTNQPGHTQALSVIETILRAYLDGSDSSLLTQRYPYAAGFIARTWQALGPVNALTDVQMLMLERLLLPFEWFAKRSDRSQPEILADCLSADGRGRKIDEQIESRAGLPQICPPYKPEYPSRLATVKDLRQREIYVVACHLADCCYELSDCHHSLLRRIEKWIHGIGTGSLSIPTQTAHAEGQRLGQILLGYALGLDHWLNERPMHFLQMDLSHLDLGFDPWPDISRVYAHLGEDHAPVKIWLAGCLWFSLVLEPPASLYQRGWRHKDLLERMERNGLSVRRWIDARIKRV